MDNLIDHIFIEQKKKGSRAKSKNSGPGDVLNLILSTLILYYHKF
jgi:hypothetical protein